MRQQDRAWHAAGRKGRAVAVAISEAYASSQSVDNDEWDLPSDSTNLGAVTDDGVYQCFLDLNALVKGDVFEFKVYEKVGSAARSAWSTPCASPTPRPSPCGCRRRLVLIHGWTMSLRPHRWHGEDDRLVDASHRLA